MKLAQIPKDQAEASVPQSANEDTRPLDEGVTAPDDDEEINIYGLDPSSPEYPAMVERMKHLRRTDPVSYRRITSLD